MKSSKTPVLDDDIFEEEEEKQQPNPFRIVVGKPILPPTGSKKIVQISSTSTQKSTSSGGLSAHHLHLLEMISTNHQFRILSSFKKFIPENPLAMFDMLKCENIKVVVIGQSPYPGKCSITKMNYACGPAFMIPDPVLTCPVSLRNLFRELRKEFPKKYRDRTVSLSLIKATVKSWISQGVFLTNLSLTIGTEDDYLRDHKNLWIPFTIQFVRVVSELVNCPVVLLGKDTWFLSSYARDKVLKFHHPASRDESQFLGCDMFKKTNELLEVTIDF